MDGRHAFFLFGFSFWQVVHTIDFSLELVDSTLEIFVFPGQVVDSVIFLDEDLLISFRTLSDTRIFNLELVINFFSVE